MKSGKTPKQVVIGTFARTAINFVPKGAPTDNAIENAIRTAIKKGTETMKRYDFQSAKRIKYKGKTMTVKEAVIESIKSKLPNIVAKKSQKSKSEEKQGTQFDPRKMKIVTPTRVKVKKGEVELFETKDGSTAIKALEENTEVDIKCPRGAEGVLIEEDVVACASKK